MLIKGVTYTCYRYLKTTNNVVSIIGSGNWASAMSKIIGTNATKFPEFDPTVKMYVYEELIDGKKLSDIINETHVNVKYLPKHRLPDNVIAEPDLLKSAKDADILIFIVPHQFIENMCTVLKGNVKESAIGLSLIKGFISNKNGSISLISEEINRKLNIDVSTLMGANIADEVADESFSESTLGCNNLETGATLKKLTQTDYFRIRVIQDVRTIEICGALKNIIALAAGFVDGLKLGANTKAAVIRIGLIEIIEFCDIFYKSNTLTFYESAGLADLIATCYGGRNRRVAEAFVHSNKTIAELEETMLNGQKLQGPITAEEFYGLLKMHKMDQRFPLMMTVRKICIGELKPHQLINELKKHPIFA